MPPEAYNHARNGYLIDLVIQVLLLVILVGAVAVLLDVVTDWPKWVSIPASVAAGCAILALCVALALTTERWYSDWKLYRAHVKAVRMLRRILTPEQRLSYDSGQPISVPVVVNGQQIGDARLEERYVVWYLPSYPNGHIRRIGQCVYTSDVNLIDDLCAKVLWIRTDPMGLAKVSGVSHHLSLAHALTVRIDR